MCLMLLFVTQAYTADEAVGPEIGQIRNLLNSVRFVNFIHQAAKVVGNFTTL
jgi:hypothetical protein